MRKDIILFVNAIRPATFAALRTYREHTGRTFKPIVVVNKAIEDSIATCNAQLDLDEEVAVISVNYDSANSVRDALRPYMDRVFAVTCQYENSVAELKRLIPYFPYLPMPSEISLDWSTEKKLMRMMLGAQDASLIPGYMEVVDSSDDTIGRIEDTLSYPLVVKPSGLEGSLLVSMVRDGQELRSTLHHTFHEIQKGYDTWIKRQTPAVLVEEFMEGGMYSIDSYVAADGSCHHLPPVKVLTGRHVGFDDFFGYMRVAPAGLDEVEIALANEAAAKAVKAVGLRSITAHVELMHTVSGWKIIELGPRIGGYRHDIYRLSYGTNHIMNDILNRAGDDPELPAESLAYTAVFNIYAPQEGVLTSIKGLEPVRDLKSFISFKRVIEVGSLVNFAKNNGDPVLEITLSITDEDQFKADIRELESVLKLGVRPLPRA